MTTRGWDSSSSASEAVHSAGFAGEGRITLGPQLQRSDPEPGMHQPRRGATSSPFSSLTLHVSGEAAGYKQEVRTGVRGVVSAAPGSEDGILTALHKWWASLPEPLPIAFWFLLLEFQ